jgi:integrase
MRSREQCLRSAGRPAFGNALFSLPRLGPTKLLTALEDQPRNRAIIEALYGTGARVDELVQLKPRQLVADIEGKCGTQRSKASTAPAPSASGGGRGRHLKRLAEGKAPDERVVSITDKRIRQILTAAAEATG